MACQRPPQWGKQGCQEGLQVRGATPAKVGGGLWHRHTNHPATHVSITVAATLEIVLPLQRTSCMAWGYQREWMLGRGAFFHTTLGPGPWGIPCCSSHDWALQSLGPGGWTASNETNDVVTTRALGPTPDHGKVKVRVWAGKGWAEQENGARQSNAALTK